ncbi:Appr-1-p processing protein [Actinoplanes philippinensis]|uniref:O-acetyl-ADP-ribose deacetylase (Regulator of RNase III), contains Macro domain n=1 Tax=Actinoplanes philippinensis TaxID=35752 RepID=A0A1I2EG88_9ACTN|nr:macro domain-containing protein [Actinoplanes philippinensis]GIE77040.1 Appr-1-p processing protein [Actinoplanes philippinensis]SFE91461.1 O-acetyl-ADP-ribose deacetylase (regulator of RNase III), contains Macro domain [Actinoplanes philippinensis]
MSAIRFVKGDATSPQAKGPKIIAHVSNDIGGWGKGFVVAISRRWREPERAFRQWHRERAGNDFGLGATQLVRVRPDVWVANMVGQRGIRTGSGGPPVRYEAIGQCLHTVAGHAVELGASVHMPRIGCGLAGGRWERIEPLIVDALCARDIPVTVYDFD